jgi:D-glycero-beta-D-manno-heptose 1-phosphate adenylyltransferase
LTAWQQAWQQKLLSPESIETNIASLRAHGHTIATLNGSFDLLHAGHLHILYEASKVADRLIVALNSDASIKRYKADNRPLVPLCYRLQLIAAIEWVDYVTWFEETDPCALLERIRPDIHVNGTEYGPDCIEGEAVRRGGGRIHLVDRIPGLATSAIIAKIRLEQEHNHTS